MSDPSGCSDDELGVLITLPSQTRLLGPTCAQGYVTGKSPCRSPRPEGWGWGRAYQPIGAHKLSLKWGTLCLSSWVCSVGSRGKRPGGQGSRGPTMPRALTIVLLLQPAQDPEDPSFWDFQGVCLLQAVRRLLPGAQLACGRRHPSGLTGAFLQLPLVIARKAVPARLSLAICTSPFPSPPSP